MSDEQDVSAGELPEAQRSLTTTIIETAAALKLLDVAVPDAYGAVKAAGKAVVDKIRDRAPEADPPAHDSDSPELHRRRDHTHGGRGHGDPPEAHSPPKAVLYS